jgi:hypothetical protein
MDAMTLRGCYSLLASPYSARSDSEPLFTHILSIMSRGEQQLHYSLELLMPLYCKLKVHCEVMNGLNNERVRSAAQTQARIAASANGLLYIMYLIS